MVRLSLISLHRQSVSRIVLALAVVSVALEVAGFLTPGWFILNGFSADETMSGSSGMTLKGGDDLSTTKLPQKWGPRASKPNMRPSGNGLADSSASITEQDPMGSNNAKEDMPPETPTPGNVGRRTTTPSRNSGGKPMDRYPRDALNPGNVRTTQEPPLNATIRTMGIWTRPNRPAVRPTVSGSRRTLRPLPTRPAVSGRPAIRPMPRPIPSRPTVRPTVNGSPATRPGPRPRPTQPAVKPTVSRRTLVSRKPTRPTVFPRPWRPVTDQSASIKPSKTATQARINRPTKPTDMGDNPVAQTSDTGDMAAMLNVGLWYSTLCRPHCSTMSLPEMFDHLYDKKAKPQLQGFDVSTLTDLRLETCCGLVFAVAGFVGTLLVLSPVCQGATKIKTAVSLIGTTISSTLFVVSLVRISTVSTTSRGSLMMADNMATRGAPWSAALCGLGACLGLVTAAGVAMVTWADRTNKWKSFDAGDEVSMEKDGNQDFTFTENTADETYDNLEVSV